MKIQINQNHYFFPDFVRAEFLKKCFLFVINYRYRFKEKNMSHYRLILLDKEILQVITSFCLIHMIQRHSNREVVYEHDRF